MPTLRGQNGGRTFFKIILSVGKACIVGASSAASRVFLVNGKLMTAQLMRENQDASPAKKGRSIQTKNIILLDAEDVNFVMEDMV